MILWGAGEVVVRMKEEDDIKEVIDKLMRILNGGLK